ncbi:MAG TPA: 4-hydroxy-3-methylbut-2-enyl diphosphate reductase [Actinobacteria bacterium]|nr:4-hydroxy-3-methylbut-2-enyl diphosphate reductase [Actinomycetota bacterium]
MKVELSKYSGYCFGVKRALKLTEEALARHRSDGKKVFTLGSIIHNPGVEKELSKQGLLSIDDIMDIEDESVFIIRSHGMSPVLIDVLKKRNIDIIDATCPFVKKAQLKASELEEMGFFVAVIGNKEHPEVCGIREHVSPDKVAVIENEEDLVLLNKKKKIGVIIQTTQTIDKLKKLTVKLLDSSREIYIVNTICDTTRNRQDSVRSLSKRTDLMLIVGGKNSANTTHLADISRKNNPWTYHIESSKDIESAWMEDAKIIGICGGASTPEKDILEIKKKIEGAKS